MPTPPFSRAFGNDNLRSVVGQLRRADHDRADQLMAIKPDALVMAANRCDSYTERIQIFSPDGDFLGQWTGMGAQRCHPRQGRQFLHRRAGRRGQAGLCLRPRWPRKCARPPGEPPCPRRRRRLARRHLRRIDHGAQRRQVRANSLSASASFVGACAPIVTGTTFISVGRSLLRRRAAGSVPMPPRRRNGQ